MTLGASPHMAPGGMLLMQYAEATMGERHRFEMHVAHFDPSTLAYTSDGAKVPSEAHVSDTYAALGALWAAYYPATWILQLLALYYNDGGSLTVAPTQPTVAPISGTNGAASVAGPSVRRFFICRSRANERRNVRLAQMPGDVIGATADLSATGGGFDARDVALLAYLSGAASGAVCPDGFAFRDQATVLLRDDRPLAPPPFDVGAQGVVPTPCLYFASHGATICNDAPGVIHTNTPAAQHAHDGTGYALPRGHRLEEYRAGGLADPSEPPVLSAYTIPGEPSGFPAGIYTLCYTLFDLAPFLGPQTLPSPAATVSVGADQWIRACVPAGLLDVHGNLPANVEVGWYILEPVAGSSVYPGNVDGHLSGYDLPCAPLANGTNPGSPQAPALNTTGVLGVRLLAPDGTPLLTHDTTTAVILAGGVPRVQAPLPALSAAPATLLGQDPDSGLPAFCPAPTTTTVALGGGGGGQPAPPAQCVQVRCGVSSVLRDHLISLYDDWRHWLDPLFQTCATLGVAVAVATVPWDWIADLGLASAGAAIKGSIVTLLQGFGGAITGNLLPPLDPDLKTHIQQAAFDALTCAGDQVQVSAAEVAAWQTALAALTTWPLASLAGPFCGVLLQYTPLAAWQGVAATASPSHFCDLWA